MKYKTVPWLVVGLMGVGVLVLAGYLIYWMQPQVRLVPPSQPRGMCTLEAKLCPDGSAVGRQGPNCEFAACPASPAPQPSRPSSGACITGGCSGEICQDASDEPAVSICLYRAEFACYKTAKCERQTNGECGWTQTAALKVCLQSPPAMK